MAKFSEILAMRRAGIDPRAELRKRFLELEDYTRHIRLRKWELLLEAGWVVHPTRPDELMSPFLPLHKQARYPYSMDRAWEIQLDRVDPVSKPGTKVSESDLYRTPALKPADSLSTEEAPDDLQY